jgi:phospholipase C
MSGIRRFSAVGGVIGFFCLLLNLSGCGSSSSTTTTPPSPSYTLTASALTPSSVTIGSPATSTLTVTPVNGYTGTVTVSCSVTGGGTPAPICSPASINVTGTTAVNSTLTVPTAGSIPGTYTFTLTAKDANNLAPSNGSQQLTLAVTAPAGPSYSLSASALNPSTVTAGNTSTSTVTITPANGYTGSVSLSCSSPVGTSVPTCSFNPSTVTINGAAATSALTVSSTASTPGGPYNVTIAASDTNNLGPSNGSQTLPLAMTAVIQHVVIIFQENRTTDNLFQGLCITPYGSTAACSTTPSSTQYNIQNFGIDSTGATVPLVPLDLGTSGANPLLYDLSHAHNAFTSMCDLDTSTNTCKMDGADLITQNCEGAPAPCGPANPQFVYVLPSDVAPYLQMAQTYTFGDQMFQTNQGPSYPAHQFILSGTSEPLTGSGLFVSENPTYLSGSTAGCIAADTTVVRAIDANGVETTASNAYVCMDHETLTDEMDAANPPVTWRYYAPSPGSIWTAPTAIQHMCGVGTAGVGTNGGSCTGPDYITTGATPKVVVTESSQSDPYPQVLTDIANNQLQQVSWVIPAGQFSDHAYSNTGCGPSWVTTVVNAIGASSYWNNTVIIVTWDDWGGWYDHVPPPQVIDDGKSWGSGYVYGFRVPIMVISPYITKSGYISHNTHDFGSILLYMENTFGLPSLGFADAYAPEDL